MTFWLLYILIGAGAGLLAGLLGVGGGIVLVPAFTFIFAAEHFDPAHSIHLALGTSLAVITFTSLSSLRAHHGHGAVDWLVVRRITPGIVCGTLVGSVFAAQLSSMFLKGFFVAFQYTVALQMFFNFRPKGHRELPGALGTNLAGGIIGGISSLVGIGGGTMSVPFMLWCNVAMHRAIGTSSAIGFPIALAGTAGYLVNGLGIASLPKMSIGFIYLPALFCVAIVSILTAPIGARLTHKLPVSRLKRFFAFFLLVVATKLLLSLF
jgi:uncharacterized membrane protein YfcA